MVLWQALKDAAQTRAMVNAADELNLMKLERLLSVQVQTHRPSKRTALYPLTALPKSLTLMIGPRIRSRGGDAPAGLYHETKLAKSGRNPMHCQRSIAKVQMVDYTRCQNVGGHHLYMYIQDALD